MSSKMSTGETKYTGISSRNCITSHFSVCLYNIIYVRGSSFIGLSDVRIVTSLLSVAIFVIRGLLPLSLSPAQPTTAGKSKTNRSGKSPRMQNNGSSHLRAKLEDDVTFIYRTHTHFIYEAYQLLSSLVQAPSLNQVV